MECVLRPPVCVCVLCGLPAAGKSTLGREICSLAAQRGWRSTVVTYDDLIPDQAFRPRLLEEHTEWKSHRQAVLKCIEQFLKNPQVMTESQIISTAWGRCVQGLLEPVASSDGSQTPLLLLLDDNFYYPSMRYEVYQLARKYSLGFCQVYLECAVESCVSRNQSRSAPVPTEVILEMAKRLESPNPQKNPWERNSIEINTTDTLSKCDIQRMMELISSALINPLSPVEDNMEQKEADRLKCATSLVHQADQACRRSISEAMKTAREHQVAPEHMRSMAAQLNECKARFLHNIKKEFLQELLVGQDEDIDVDRVVKTAVTVFDQDINDIVMRIIKA